MLRLTTILLSIVGLSVGIWAVATADEKKPEIPLAREPVVNPYLRGVAALGIVEPAERNISVVSPELGIVVEVLVDAGQQVKVGDALFRLDSRTIDADMIRAKAAVATGEAAVARWQALPRPEDIPPLEALVAGALASLNDREEQRKLVGESAARGSGTDRDISRAIFGVSGAQAELTRARAELAKLQAGGWKPDLDALNASLNLQKAEVEALELLRTRLTVRAPRSGKILRRLVEPGEYASTDSSRPSLILGDLTQLHVRAQVDEEDIGLISQVAYPWVVIPTPGLAPSGTSVGAPSGDDATRRLRATGRTRGAKVTTLDLEFIRIEPFARPKSDLLGMNSERVDTRVIDVVFRVRGVPEIQVFPGQAVDVFIAEAE